MSAQIEYVYIYLKIIHLVFQRKKANVTIITHRGNKSFVVFAFSRDSLARQVTCSLSHPDITPLLSIVRDRAAVYVRTSVCAAQRLDEKSGYIYTHTRGERKRKDARAGDLKSPVISRLRAGLDLERERKTARCTAGAENEAA